MLVRIDLARHAGYWQFPGSVAFSNWLAECPWLGSGATCIARLSGRSHGRHFIQALTRELFAWDSGQSTPRVDILFGDDLDGDLERALATRLGVAEQAKAWEMREALARVLAERPAVLLIAPATAKPTLDLYQEAEALRDRISKSRFRGTLTWILMDNATGRLDGRRSFDFTRGRPAFGIFDTSTHTELNLWSAYVHTRLAWESGGNTAIASELDATISEQTAALDDDVLEHAFNTWSRARLADSDATTRDAFERFLERGTGDTRSLSEQGLLWRPPGHPSPVPVPWLSRALLNANNAHPRRWLLRNSLVCMPLANELLSICQAIEHHIKSNVAATAHQPEAPPEDLVATWQRVREGEDETTLYPRNHPAPPTTPADVWTYASLGQFLRPESPLGRHPSATERSLNRLRNTLAHGHFAGWHQVAAMRRILDALGR